MAVLWWGVRRLQCLMPLLSPWPSPPATPSSDNSVAAAWLLSLSLKTSSSTVKWR